MRRSFTYSLLITYIFITGACKTHFNLSSVDMENIVVVDSLNSPDKKVVQIYQPYKNMLDEDMNRVISFSEEEMVKGKPESSLTNFLADLLLEEGKKEALSEGLTKIQPSISYQNYGGIRASLPKGEITVGKIYELMPFENEMVFVLLSGEQIQSFLNIIAAKGGDSLGGVRFVISGSKATHVEIGGLALNPDLDYWVVTNDYIANGGDDMNVFLNRKELINSGKKIRDIIIQYLEDKQKSGETISEKPDGRIRYE